ncbi:unnamed protein product, partial [Nesidiocoris tenuis]
MIRKWGKSVSISADMFRDEVLDRYCECKNRSHRSLKVSSGETLSKLREKLNSAPSPARAAFAAYPAHHYERRGAWRRTTRPRTGGPRSRGYRAHRRGGP